MCNLTCAIKFRPQTVPKASPERKGTFHFQFELAARKRSFARMRSLSLRLIVALTLILSVAAHAEEARIIKVLPHFLDAKGRHAVSPSLYERDAYQGILRKNPELRSGIRFDVQWKAKGRPEGELKLKVEIRGGPTNAIEEFSFEQPVQKDKWGSSWGSVTVAGKDYRKVGQMIAWRVTLWNANRQLAEQKSFMW